MSSDPSKELPDRLPQRRPTRVVLLWSMWGRETVKDLVLLFAALPVLVTLMFVPVLAVDGGPWARLIGLLVVFAAIWFVLRLVMRRWVAAGDRGDEPPPSRR